MSREQLLATVETYARAYQDAARMRAADLPVLPHQTLALRSAGAAAGRPCLVTIVGSPCCAESITAENVVLASFR